MTSRGRSAKAAGSSKASMPPTRPSASRRLFDGAVMFFVALAAVSSAAVLWLKGTAVFVEDMRHALGLLVTVMPSIAVGLLLGGLAMQLTDPKRVAPVLGAQSGWFGLVLATGLGAITPGGPFAAFPIVYAFFLAGADIGAVVAYLTAWSVIGLHRVVVWELPLLGFDFALARAVSSLPLPVLAGALARLIARGPLQVTVPSQPPPGAPAKGKAA